MTQGFAPREARGDTSDEQSPGKLSPRLSVPKELTEAVGRLPLDLEPVTPRVVV
jgi:hypothetical protein